MSKWHVCSFITFTLPASRSADTAATPPTGLWRPCLQPERLSAMCLLVADQNTVSFLFFFLPQSFFFDLFPAPSSLLYFVVTWPNHLVLCRPIGLFPLHVNSNALLVISNLSVSEYWNLLVLTISSFIFVAISVHLYCKAFQHDLILYSYTVTDVSPILDSCGVRLYTPICNTDTFFGNIRLLLI